MALVRATRRNTPEDTIFQICCFVSGFHAIKFPHPNLHHSTCMPLPLQTSWFQLNYTRRLVIITKQCVGSEVLTAIAMNAVIFWDTAPCSPYTIWRFGGTYHLCPHGGKLAEQETSLTTCCILVSWYTDFWPSIWIWFETSVRMPTTRRYIPEDDTIQQVTSC
jgi:hypothetical protein